MDYLIMLFISFILLIFYSNENTIRLNYTVNAEAFHVSLDIGNPLITKFFEISLDSNYTHMFFTLINQRNPSNSIISLRNETIVKE